MTDAAEAVGSLLPDAWVNVPYGGGGEDEDECMPGDSWAARCCPRGPLALFGGGGGFPRPVLEDAMSSAGKLELHRVLNAFQHSTDYGVHVCESFKDPRRFVLDDYWDEVFLEAFSIDDLHHAVGGLADPLTDDARARLHQFARVLERLSKRIDRVVVGTSLHPPMMSVKK